MKIFGVSSYGVLSITDTSLKVKITMFGFYTTADFIFSPAVGNRTPIMTDYIPPESLHPYLARNHHYFTSDMTRSRSYMRAY
jgi:hypothetical protein